MKWHPIVQVDRLLVLAFVACVPIVGCGDSSPAGSGDSGGDDSQADASGDSTVPPDSSSGIDSSSPGIDATSGNDVSSPPDAGATPDAGSTDDGMASNETGTLSDGAASDVSTVGDTGSASDAGADAASVDGTAGDASAEAAADSSTDANEAAADAMDAASDASDASVDANDAGSDGEAGSDASDAGADASADASDAAPDGPKCVSTVLTPTTAIASTAMRPASNAIDGIFTSRWESTQGVDPSWIYLDFGAPVFVNRVQILWEAACGQDYELQVSSDATTWTTMKAITGNALGTAGAPANWTGAADHTGFTGVGRYMRVYGTVRCLNYGYSIWEMRAYGDTNASCTP